MCRSLNSYAYVFYILCTIDLVGFNLNEKLDDQWSALLYACNAVRSNIITFLLENGVDAKHKNKGEYFTAHNTQYIVHV